MTLEALNTGIVDLEETGRAGEYSERIQRMLLQICKALKPLSPLIMPPRPRDPPPATPFHESPPRDSLGVWNGGAGFPMICRGAVFPEGKPYFLGNFAWGGG